jgi:hypothetical protein
MEFKTIAANFLLTNLVKFTLADSHIEQVLLTPEETEKMVAKYTPESSAFYLVKGWYSAE